MACGLIIWASGGTCDRIQNPQLDMIKNELQGHNLAASPVRYGYNRDMRIRLS